MNADLFGADAPELGNFVNKIVEWDVVVGFEAELLVRIHDHSPLQTNLYRNVNISRTLRSLD
ncbi:hypothetical protein EA58_21225 [Photobacterium galatheae]|uniref:Uncharacterized protein n=1 Tax=Photobacterium galatheae TaxID=1654360 RepID=A0A066RH33_9GAMM|nr:hypothetical protein EA58_21225 [Photobacterium galatheae]